MSKKTIAVDFDHTISLTDDEYSTGNERPNEPVIEWMWEQYYEGHTLLVWTARPWKDAPFLVSRLEEWEVPWHGIKCNKGGADVYVDDKALDPETIA